MKAYGLLLLSLGLAACVSDSAVGLKANTKEPRNATVSRPYVFVYRRVDLAMRACLTREVITAKQRNRQLARDVVATVLAGPAAIGFPNFRVASKLDRTRQTGAVSLFVDSWSGKGYFIHVDVERLGPNRTRVTTYAHRDHDSTHTAVVGWASKDKPECAITSRELDVSGIKANPPKR